MMRKLLPLWGLCALVLWAGAARASDPIGIYALVDRVTFEPSESAPERIVVEGAFAIADRADRNLYAPAQAGTLYFKLPAARADLAKNEWEDFKRMAGSNRVVAFGSRYAETPRPTVRSVADATRTEPDTYPLGFGMNVSGRDVQYGPMKELMRLPRPQAVQVKGGNSILAARNIALDNANAKYHFEIQNEAGEREASPAIAPGDKVTMWTPKMTIRDGQKYTWRVWAELGQERGPVATATLVHGGSK